jgi:phage terminase Nu1 subunit (DNA packaging protein)
MPKASRRKSAVNQTELAQRLGVSTTTISQWRSMGMPFERQGSEGTAYSYDVQRCRLWRDEHRRDNSDARDAVRFEREQIELRKARLDLDEREGRLFEASVFDEVIRYVYARVQARFHQLGASVARSVDGLTLLQQRQVKDYIDTGITSALRLFNDVDLPGRGKRMSRPSGHDTTADGD